jgi:hypothetical protein
VAPHALETADTCIRDLGIGMYLSGGKCEHCATYYPVIQYQSIPAAKTEIYNVFYIKSRALDNRGAVSQVHAQPPRSLIESYYGTRGNMSCQDF